MENFAANLKKYKREFEQLEKSNVALAKKAQEGEKSSIFRELTRSKLQSDYDNLRRFVDSLPDEIKRQAKTTQKSKSIERG